MRVKKIFILTLVFAAILMLIINTEKVTCAAISSLKLCAFSVIPSLFPFFVLSQILVNTGLIALVGKFLEPISKKLFKVSGKGAVVFVIGILCGYPTGAKVTADLCEQGKISINEGSRLLAFCNNSGPLFVIGAVGYGMIGNKNTGILLYIIHVISAIITGILLSFFAKEDKNEKNDEYVVLNIGNAIAESVEGAVRAVLNVCGYVVFFGCIYEIIKEIVPNLFINALLEVTTGAKTIICADLIKEDMLTLLSGVIGFGGICVLLQVQGAVKKTDLLMRTYFFGKVVQMAISMMITRIILKTNQNISVFSPNVMTPQTTFEISYIILFLFLLSMIFFMLRLTKKN